MEKLERFPGSSATLFLNIRLFNIPPLTQPRPTRLALFKGQWWSTNPFLKHRFSGGVNIAANTLTGSTLDEGSDWSKIFWMLNDKIHRAYHLNEEVFTLPPIIMEVENGPLETKVIFQAPIFHFHDYGRKGTVPAVYTSPCTLLCLLTCCLFLGWGGVRLTMKLHPRSSSKVGSWESGCSLSFRTSRIAFLKFEHLEWLIIIQFLQPNLRASIREEFPTQPLQLGCAFDQQLARIKKKSPKINFGVSKNRGTPKSSILIGFSLINHPFWGTIIFGNNHLLFKT